MTPSPSEQQSASDRRTLLIVAAVVLGVVGMFAGPVIYFHYFRYAIVDGPHERALVAAIRARDVAAARAAIAAGATLTEPLPVVEETFESRSRGGREFYSALWLVIREMSAQTELARADRRKLEQLARVMFEAGGDPNAWVSMSNRRTAGRSRYYLIEDAVKNGTPELIQMMVDAGLDMKGEGVGLALVDACGFAGDQTDDAVALTLIRAGADVNFSTRTGETPLSTAVSFKRVALIDALKRAGASE